MTHVLMRIATVANAISDWFGTQISAQIQVLNMFFGYYHHQMADANQIMAVVFYSHFLN